MLLKETKLLNASDNNLLSIMRAKNITTVEQVLARETIKETEKETFSSLQYQGLRDIIKYKYQQQTSDLENYLNRKIKTTARGMEVEGIDIDFYYHHITEQPLTRVLYRLGFNRRDSVLIRYFTELTMRKKEDPTLEEVFENMVLIKDTLIKKERDKCLFHKIEILLEISKKRKEENDNKQKAYEYVKINTPDQK